jgi:glycosyltransferase involved in cell wall biosynthesis
MNIAIDSRSASLHKGSGIGTYTENLIHNLNDFIDLSLICTGDINKLKLTGNNKVFYCSGKHTSFFDNCYIPNLLEKNNIDLYHIPQNGIGFPFDSNLKVVVTIHDLIPYIMPETVGNGYLERFLKDMPRIIALSKGIITVSEYSKKDIIRFFPKYDPNKIFVTPLAANQSFKPLPPNVYKNYLKNNYNITEPYILYIGGFSPRKNVMGLINAFEKIINKLDRQYKLLIGGALKDDGLLLKEYVISKKLTQFVIFTGYLNDTALPYFYNGCDLFVYPSFYEGFGLPPLEAMSCKKPVIASKNTSVPEITKDAALLIDANNIDELAGTMQTLLSDNELRIELAEKAYKRSLQFSWRQTAINTINCYKEILNSID